MYNLKYTKHSLERMEERNISKEDIELLLNSTFLEAKSKQDTNIILVIGSVGTKGIALILDQSTHNLITVRNMRANEKKLFKEKGGLPND